MLAIRLPKDIEARLAALAAKTGRTKTFYAKEAILEYMDDMEDKYLAINRLENPGSIPLELIEIQSGSYLGEDDIVRYEDIYDRG